METSAAKKIVDYCINMPERTLLALLFLTALLVRIIGINYGYWHGDERVNDAAKVLAGQIIPEQHFYPPFFNYLNAVFFALMYAVGRATSIWFSTADFRAQYFDDPAPFYLLSRFITACFSAATACLFYSIARAINLNKTQSIAVGVFGVFLPVMVLLFHIAKSDVPLAMTFVLAIFLLIKKYQHLDEVKYDVLLGFTCALALSFKHSAVFFLFPLALGHCVLLIRERSIEAIKPLVFSVAALVPAWLVMNVGIILDFQDFLDYQKIQAVMSVRQEVTLWSAISAWFDVSAHNSYGVNVIVTVMFWLFPVYLNSPLSQLRHKSILNLSWGSVAIGIFVVTVISGARQHSGLWVPYLTAVQLFVALMFIDLCRNATKSISYISVLASGVTIVVSLFGVASILGQALAEPNSRQLASWVRDNHADRKMVTSYALTLPRTLDARAFGDERDQRIAKKYDVVLPERAAEYYLQQEEPGAMHFIYMPEAMHGLNDADDELLEGVVKPYAWPLQKEEWKLDYWLDLGYDLFIVRNYQFHITEDTNQIRFDFYTEVNDRCRRDKDFAAVKSYFLEFDVTIMDCGNARATSDI